MVKRILASCLIFGSLSMMAQSRHHAVDTMKVVDLDEVNVISTRAGATTPVAHTNVSKEQIAELNTGKDLPYILSQTPSVTTTSDAGNGMGYTTLRVRGVDPSRINITANGIPMNDAESAQVYWVNIPDFASSAESVQIQRGAGTSTNGAGAFGATVNIQTARLGTEPSFGYDMSAGSYGTHKETFRFASGLLGDHWAVQGRLSNIATDGYIDRASVRLGSYFLQAAYYGDNTVVKFITFNGQEKTYHAWNYTSKYEQSLYGRTYNSCGEYYGDDGKPHYYDNQTDNYHQQHYQLLWNQDLGSMLKLNLGLHLTKGDGYYEQYKVGKRLYQFNLNQPGDYKTTSDLINQKKMDNDFYGFIGSLNYDNKQGLSAALGGGWNVYDGDHFGKVIWAKDVLIQPDFEYYNNNGKKYDGNLYGKVNYEFLKGLNAFIDLQYRHASIRMNGLTDDYDKSYQQINFNERHAYNFFNPKFGLFYQINPHHHVYGNFSIAHKEPTRNDFEDNIGVNLKAEKLTDWELGYQYRNTQFSAGFNFYLMNYANQFVLTGQLNEIGEMIASNDNSGKSYRAGIELEAAYQPTKWFRWDVNATFSRNRNKDWTVSAVDGIAYENSDGDDWNSQGTINLGETKTSFSPEIIFNNILTFNWKGFKAQLQSQYISKQYMTNTGFRYAKVGNEYVKLFLSDYFTNNLDLSYTFKFKGIKSATIGATLYNLTSLKYDNNGWAYCEIGKDANGKAYAWTTDLYKSGFAPQAPIHFMAHLSLNF
ncbi:MAG: TonB-dependent receptor [Bacteroidaceae bacterium]|nr:TonB-dependent receptor [Bacteroidaceae bacterium]